MTAIIVFHHGNDTNDRNGGLDCLERGPQTGREYQQNHQQEKQQQQQPRIGPQQPIYQQQQPQDSNPQIMAKPHPQSGMIETASSVKGDFSPDCRPPKAHLKQMNPQPTTDSTTDTTASQPAEGSANYCVGESERETCHHLQVALAGDSGEVDSSKVKIDVPASDTIDEYVMVPRDERTDVDNDEGGTQPQPQQDKAHRDSKHDETTTAVGGDSDTGTDSDISNDIELDCIDQNKAVDPANAAWPLQDSPDENAGTAAKAKADETPTATLSDPSTEPALGSDSSVAQDDDELMGMSTDLFKSDNVSNKQIHGGLRNLGNTCYFNSAIQMLRSLDGFAAAVKKRNLQLQAEVATQVQTQAELTGPNLIKSGSANDDVPSRLAVVFSDVIDRLNDGETVEPRELKQCIDERSSLFVGYRQQDAHEFLTTLLDLLDEDHKVKNNEMERSEECEKKTESVNTSNEIVTAETTESTEVTEMETFQSLNEYEIVSQVDQYENDTENHDSTGGFLETNNNATPSVAVDCGTDDDNDVNVNDDNDEISSVDDEHTGLTQRLDTLLPAHPMESALKRSRFVQPTDIEMDDTSVTEATEEMEDDDSLATALLESQMSIMSGTTLTTVKSFKDLEMKDIEDLLHDTSMPIITNDSCRGFSAESTGNEERFKLVGGRMSMSDVTLTPLNDSFRQQSELPLPVQTRDSIPADDASMGESTDESDVPVLKTPVDEHFTTDVRVTLTCDSCKYSRHQTETYSHISVEIDSGSSVNVDSSVDEGLRKFFAVESRDVKCEKCFCATARQTREIVRVPRALLVHLKRFIVDISPDYTSVSYRKNRIPVVINKSLPLDESGVLGEVLAVDVTLPPNETSTFHIRSIVNHIGSSASCGHYTADGYCRNESGGRQWTRFNDSFVSDIDEERALDGESKTTAYMVMYELE